VAGRLPRVNTREAITYQDYIIPVNTPVSITQKLIHDNPAIFPSPRSFLPERWLVAPEERKRLEKYLQPFGRGSRSCIGIQYVTPWSFPSYSRIARSPHSPLPYFLGLITDYSSLAYSEIYVTVAALFSELDLTLFDTEEIDIVQFHDFFSPFPTSNRGLRVTVS